VSYFFKTPQQHHYFNYSSSLFHLNNIFLISLFFLYLIFFECLSFPNSHIFEYLSFSNGHIFKNLFFPNSHIYEYLSYPNGHIFEILSFPNSNIFENMSYPNDHIVQKLSYAFTINKTISSTIIIHLNQDLFSIQSPFLLLWLVFSIRVAVLLPKYNSNSAALTFLIENLYRIAVLEWQKIKEQCTKSLSH